MSPQSPKTFKADGFSLIEVLVTMLILMGGLLGLAGLQGVALTAQLEAFQRAQALVLVQDMAARINANRVNSSAYAGAALGTGSSQSTACAGTGKDLDFCEWHKALLGAAETTSGGGGTLNVGAMVNARGCITETVATAPKQYRIEVAWQGFNPTVAPLALTCGQNLYGAENLRRVVSLTVTIGSLGI